MGLRRLGIERVVLATGDRRDVAEEVAAGLRLDEVHADLTPGRKIEIVQAERLHGPVMMIGDGLNDAGALKQSNVGIAVSEQSNNFTPASDGIIAAKQLPALDKFIRLSKMNRKIVLASFALSVLYNVIGLSFAVQAALSPLIAAILMPASSLSIVLLSFGASNIAARLMKLE